jgi:beta-galactosidase
MAATKFREIIFSALLLFSLVAMLVGCASADAEKIRSIEKFNKDWTFYLGDDSTALKSDFDDSKWRKLNLPHDWSIEGKFNEANPATVGGGALPGGIGWYRKTFEVSTQDSGKLFYIDFDGVYRNSEVWINGNYLGKRPFGYISFRYELTPFLKFGQKNVISVKVDNSKQPNSRWYSGSGIYRNVWLVKTNKIAVDHWGTFVTTPKINNESAEVMVQTKIKNSLNPNSDVILLTEIYDAENNKVTETESKLTIEANSTIEAKQQLIVDNPKLWSTETPYMYKVISKIIRDKEVIDDYETPLGIRSFIFDAEKGFILNGKQVKINGVCNHHDLGFLGAAINYRALERQLEIMKEIGINGIRTSHNPPAPELLELCDKMGFVVMNESFDMWKKGKTQFDYSLDWDEWHKRDLEDFILRDRNHPSIVMWSIGNEIIEQWDEKDPSGEAITKELTAIVKNLDKTRPVTAGCNRTDAKNPLLTAGVLDIVGFNYHQDEYLGVPKLFPGKPFISTESVSALATRGHYDMPSDSIRRWPIRWDIPFTTGNPDNTCSAYDNVSAPWGSTNIETWRVVKKHDFMAGQFIWTGFDYLGEPTPYGWPSRSSYFGIIDLAGFPKDAYYLYQSEWTNKNVLHLFPHWNWKEGQLIDMVTYTNCDDVELFVNGKSKGTKKKGDEDYLLMWRVNYEPGSVKAVGKKAGKIILEKEIFTAGSPYQIKLEVDRNTINANGEDLSFITVTILDDKGNVVPNANNNVKFSVKGEGKIAGVDNGLQTSMESFQANNRNAFNGKCLVVVQSSEKAGKIELTASSAGLKGQSITITAK